MAGMIRFRRIAHNKLRAKRGASITMALLLFLVCSVIGSVVLAAGTASAGRMSQLSAMDKRYYSVASAAGVFRDLLNGQSYTVSRTETVTVTKTDTVTLDVAGNTVGTARSQTSGTPTYTNVFSYTADDGGTYSFRQGSSFLADAALYYVFGDSEDYETAEAWECSPGSTRTWQLSVDAADTGALSVDVTAELRTDGTLLLEFSNAEGRETYRMTMKLNAEVYDTSSAPTPKVTTEQSTTTAAASGGGHTVTTTTVTRTARTKTTTLTWTTEGRQW